MSHTSELNERKEVMATNGKKEPEPYGVRQIAYQRRLAMEREEAARAKLNASKQ